MGRRRLTSKAWFGPKRLLGWGWAAASWEGWVACVVFIALLIGTLSLHGASRTGSVIALVAAFGVLVLLTGDPPGGPDPGSEPRAFRARADRRS